VAAAASARCRASASETAGSNTTRHLCARCDDDLANAHALDSALEVSAEDGIAIAEQVSGAGLVRERVDDLLGRPRGSGLVGDADVEEFSAVVVEDHEGEYLAARTKEGWKFLSSHTGPCKAP